MFRVICLSTKNENTLWKRTVAQLSNSQSICTSRACFDFCSTTKKTRIPSRSGGLGQLIFYHTLCCLREKPQALQRLRSETTVDFIVNLPKSVSGETKVLVGSYSYKRKEVEKERNQRNRITTSWIQRHLLGQWVDILSVVVLSVAVFSVSEPAGVQDAEAQAIRLQDSFTCL